MKVKHHDFARKRPGPRTKAERGERTHKRLSVTIPWELWIEVDKHRLSGEGNSKLIQRLLSKWSKKNE